MQSPKINGLLLITNLGLVVAILFLVKLWPKPTAISEPAISTLTPTTSQTAAAAPATVIVTNELKWAQLEAEDYPTYIARLRAIGCPEQTIRDIIIADLDKLLAPKVQALYGRRPVLHYWESEEEELANNHDHREWLKQERDIDREKRKIIQDLVGVDVVRERLKQRGYQDYYERRLTFLPEEKRGTVRMILEKFDEQEQELRDLAADAEDGTTPFDQNRLKQLQEQRSAELASVMTPAEQEEYELWTSPSANTVRRSMYGMEATEEEFRSVYEAQRAFDTKWNFDDLNNANDATLLQWHEDREKMYQQIRERLGEERFAEFKRGEDPDFHTLNAAISRYKLPRERAAEAYEIKRSVQQMAAEVRANPALSAAAKQDVLNQMARETEFAMRQLLGNSAYRHFQQQSQVNWINN